MTSQVPERGGPQLPGCARCFAADPDRAWEKVRQVPVRFTVADDPHFIVSIRRCPECSQHFAWIFTEFVDWESGDDAQYRHIFPLASAEAAALAARGQDAGLGYLGSLAAGRWILSSSWPTGQAQPHRFLGISPGPLPITPGH